MCCSCVCVCVCVCDVKIDSKIIKIYPIIVSKIQLVLFKRVSCFRDCICLRGYYEFLRT